jgi:predicted O-linked N-acetylglucosamine transferase (SPINDLY family)
MSSTPRPNLANTFALALQHHQAGRLSQAAQLYQEIIALDPQHADALRLYGVIAHQVGRHELAADLIGQAIKINPRIPEYHNDLGLALHALGRFQPAIAAFQAALQLQPNLPEAQYNLANTLRADGQLDHAIATYNLALQLRPNYPEALNNLGNALKDRQQFAQAVAAFRQAVAIQPRYVQALCNLGNALQTLGQAKASSHQPHDDSHELQQAVEAYRAALALQPNDPQIHNNLGTALETLGRSDEALACYQAALRLMPRYADAWFNLGNLLRNRRHFGDATRAYRNALEVQPQYPEALNNLANALRDQGELEQAIATYRQALALKPDFPEALNNLATALKDHGDTDDAVAAFHAALKLKPDYATALSNLGNVLKDQGLLPEALAAMRQAVALRPAIAELHNNLIYTLHFDPAYDPRAVARELALWNERHAEPLVRLIRPHDNDRSPGGGDRPLRIGFVSPDFRSHPIGRFLLPLFEAHTPDPNAEFRYFCYSDAPFPPSKPDPITTRLKPHADRWHNTADLLDTELAALIRLDKIDLLLDLTMHMEGSRLTLFAQKPAPVQITYLAYPTSTGISAMDYRLTDAAFDPPESDTSIYTEKTLRLRSYWCYPKPDNAPEVAPPPSTTGPNAGTLTFACLNNFAKVSPQALATWIDILKALPNSRLFLHAPPGSHRDRTRQTLATAGINPDRLSFFGFLPFPDYLALHNQIDIALDPFPYAGGTTSCDALYMGVPLLTLAGPTALSRGGTSILTALNLPDLIAPTPAAYTQLALTLAQDLPRLATLRQELRPRMEASILMNAQAYTQDFHATLRHAWRQWCQSANESI